MTERASGLPSEADVLARLQAMQPVQLELSPLQAFTLIGHLQLALRHPGNVGPSADMAEAIARMMQDALTWQDATVGAAVEAGWNPCFDVPTNS